LPLTQAVAAKNLQWRIHNMAAPINAADIPTTTPISGSGLLVNQCDRGPYDEPCCGNGVSCSICSFLVTDCKVEWDCPEDVIATEVYRDDVLISTDRSGVIGQPPIGAYRIRRKCGALWQTQYMGYIGGTGSCGNCCESIGRADCSSPVVLTISGLPPYPAWAGWDGSYVMNCVPGFTDRCYRDFSLARSFPGCTGPLPTTNIYPDDFRMRDYSLFFVWDSFVGTGPLGRVTHSDSVVYSRKISPTVCDEFFGNIGGSTRFFNTTECKLPIRGTITRPHPSQYLIFGLEFASFFGPSVATYSFDFSIE
jgi:hypothetical protein